MKNLPRFIAFIASALVLLLFVYPLWRITLEAPQYPEGISMYIWINQITGDTPGTLQNINILNHYVGMQQIVPSSIPELQYFPYVVAALGVLGLIAALVNRPKVYLIWVIIFGALAFLGIYDFYLWEYDYGHNLSATAPIKVPGQAYQPPLFGSKMLLNFNAISYPAGGGIFMGISLMLSFLAYLLSRSSKKTPVNSASLKAPKTKQKAKPHLQHF